MGGVGVKENNVYLVTPLLWWRGLRGTCVLAEVAVKVIGAPVTSPLSGTSALLAGFIVKEETD